MKGEEDSSEVVVACDTCKSIHPSRSINNGDELRLCRIVGSVVLIGSLVKRWFPMEFGQNHQSYRRVVTRATVSNNDPCIDSFLS